MREDVGVYGNRMRVCLPPLCSAPPHTPRFPPRAAAATTAPHPLPAGLDQGSILVRARRAH
eukprot:4236747-Prymnesium_polylepis.1